MRIYTSYARVIIHRLRLSQIPFHPSDHTRHKQVHPAPLASALSSLYLDSLHRYLKFRSNMRQGIGSTLGLPCDPPNPWCARHRICPLPFPPMETHAFPSLSASIISVRILSKSFSYFFLRSMSLGISSLFSFMSSALFSDRFALALPCI